MCTIARSYFYVTIRKEIGTYTFWEDNNYLDIAFTIYKIWHLHDRAIAKVTNNLATDIVWQYNNEYLTVSRIWLQEKPRWSVKQRCRRLIMVNDLYMWFNETRYYVSGLNANIWMSIRKSTGATRVRKATEREMQYDHSISKIAYTSHECKIVYSVTVRSIMSWAQIEHRLFRYENVCSIDYLN